MRLEQLHPDVFLIHEALTPERARELITFAEGLGFEPAPVTTAHGPRMIPQVRDNTRVMRDDPELAQALFASLRPLFPERWERVQESACVGLNERLRFYRYARGERFKMHRDGRFERGDGEHSKLTILFYLNEDFEGGHTRILTAQGELDVHPCLGSALCFKHELRHEGEPVLEGLKYVLRSDVMYSAAARGGSRERHSIST